MVNFLDRNEEHVGILTAKMMPSSVSGGIASKRGAEIVNANSSPTKSREPMHLTRTRARNDEAQMRSNSCSCS